MGVNVLATAVIERPIGEVAAYVGDPSNAPEWYRRIGSAEWQTEPPIALGSQVRFRARFLGRDLAYTYEIVEYAPGERVAMRTAEGPFPMETSYRWDALGPARTRMTLRNRGTPSGFARIGGPLMERAMRRANTKDLDRLRSILEADDG